MAETGSGKTGAFALPILQALLQSPQRYFALILTPTRELAFQISEQFEALGKRNKFYNYVYSLFLETQILSTVCFLYMTYMYRIYYKKEKLDECTDKISYILHCIVFVKSKDSVFFYYSTLQQKLNKNN